MFLESKVVLLRYIKTIYYMAFIYVDYITAFMFS
jgi:hypothetical protein